VKLIRVESESGALLDWLGDREVVSSALVLTEVARAGSRHSTDVEATAELLESLRLVDLDRDLLREAGRVAPALLRTLDAIHLVTALRLRAGLDAFVCYDERLADAAHAVGLRVEAPA